MTDHTYFRGWKPLPQLPYEQWERTSTSSVESHFAAVLSVLKHFYKGFDAGSQLAFGKIAGVHTIHFQV